MNKITKIISKNNWTYHINGGYWTREILDDDAFDQAVSELEALRAVVDAALEIVNDWDEKTPHIGFIQVSNMVRLKKSLKAVK